jgi:hypothetical protein
MDGLIYPSLYLSWDVLYHYISDGLWGLLWYFYLSHYLGYYLSWGLYGILPRDIDFIW